jgi:hypothetical protein
MNCLALVTKGLLRETLRVTHLFSPFGPRISVAVERYALNSKELTAAVKLGCSVVCVRSGQSGEERSLMRKFPENSLQVLADDDVRS